MAQTALFVVRGDPRSSPRPAEAIRVAAGLVSWRRSRITVYLHGPAVLLLSTASDTLIDEDNVRRYLPILAGQLPCAYVEPSQPLLSQVHEPAWPFEELILSRLAVLAAASDLVLRF